MFQTKKHCEPLVAVSLRPSTTKPCICCKQVAEKPRGEHLKNDDDVYSWNLSVYSRNWHLLMPKIKITYLRKSELRCAWHFNKSYSNGRQPTTLLFDLVSTCAASYMPSAKSQSYFRRSVV